MIKALIKSVVPAPVISRAVRAKNELDIALYPKAGFNPANLAPAVNLQQVWNDPDTERFWEDSYAHISAQIGDTDMWGGINPGDRRALFYLIMALKPRQILEVGTHIGASTLYAAQALKQRGKGGLVTTVDILDVNAESGPWKNSVLPGPPRQMAETLGCEGLIAFQTGNCLDFMHKTDKKFDLIFLDGDHSAKAVYQEVSAALSCLSPAGRILLHDYYPGEKPLFPNNVAISGPYLAVERIKKEAPAFDILPLGELPWPTKAGTNKTSLALLYRKNRQSQ